MRTRLSNEKELEFTQDFGCSCVAAA